MTLNGKLMFLMLPQELLHGAESAAAAAILFVMRRRGIKRMMKEGGGKEKDGLREEFVIINADEEGEDWLLN